MNKQKLIETLYENAHDELSAHAVELCKDEGLAQDLVQELYLHVTENSEKLSKYIKKDIEPLVLYLKDKTEEIFKTMYDEKGDLHINTDEYKKIEVKKLTNKYFDVEEFYDKYLSKLNKNYRKIILYQYFYKYDAKEIMNEMNLTREQYKSNLKRAKAAIKKMIVVILLGILAALLAGPVTEAIKRWFSSRVIVTDRADVIEHIADVEVNEILEFRAPTLLKYFDLVSEDKSFFRHARMYKTDKGERIVFTQVIAGGAMHYNDNEHGTTQELKINTKDAYLYDRGEKEVNLEWSDESYTYNLIMPSEYKDKILYIAVSLAAVED